MNKELGETLGHYRLIEKLGEGGMGVVWKAVDTRLDREVAIKLLPEKIREDRDQLARFKQEAKALAALNHPNIITVYSIEETDDKVFFTMELVRGKSLGTVIPAGGLPFEKVLEIAISVADAMQAAHERDIVHRDLKPGNIMLTDGEGIKILDFGLAASSGKGPLADIASQPTWTDLSASRLFGTVPYMSPEQLRGEVVDPRSDLFSLGIILYQISTNQLPFESDTAAVAVASILRDRPKPIRLHNAGIPVSFWLVIRQCLEKEMDERIQSALDLRNQLEQIQSNSAFGPRTAPSVAVLPFADLSPHNDQTYFCEGIAEEIINALTKIKGLQVVPRTSSFGLSSVDSDGVEIGRKLGVKAVLEGSVRKAEDRFRIRVELTDVAGGFNLWSERYENEIRDVFSIQDEISRNVAEALQLTLGPREHTGLGFPTPDVEAYDYYLRGRNFYFQYRRKAVEYAIDMFTHAIKLEPDYSRAYAGIADCHSYLYLYSERVEHHRLEAEEASLKAIDLDPSLAEAHASQGLALSISRRDEEARRSFEHAIRLNLGLFEAHYYYARHCFTLGEFDKAIWLYEQASIVNPEDYQALLLVSQIYADLGRLEEAQSARRRGLKIADEHLRVHPEDTRAWYMGANALVSLGDITRGLEWADRALAIEPKEPMLLYNLGCIKSLAGRIEEAIVHLQNAVAFGLHQKEWFEMDSNLDPLRQHPRFRKLMRRLG
jgi:serine/threonine protein kinase/Flp pilus assembly protein TadD